MLDQLMSAIPTQQVAAAVGEDETDVRAALQAALPALLGGLSANAQHTDGARSLLDALGKHQGGLDDVRLDAIDTEDGLKIVNHVFGTNTDAVVNQLGGMGGGQSSALIKKILPIVAPIVLSWLAQRVSGALSGQGGGQAGSAPGTGLQPDGPLGQGVPTSAPAPGGGAMDPTAILQDILGGALGGATGGASSSGGAGGILGDILGGILGGRR